MTDDFIEDYIKSSPSQRKLKEAIVDKTEDEIRREYQLQKFYDAVTTNPWCLRNIMVGGVSSAMSNAEAEHQMSLMHLTYSASTFKPLTTSLPGNLTHPIMMHQEQEVELTLEPSEYYKNKKLLRILVRWDSMNSGYLNGLGDHCPAIAMLGFSKKEVRKMYEEEK